MARTQTPTRGRRESGEDLAAAAAAAAANGGEVHQVQCTWSQVQGLATVYFLSNQTKRKYAFIAIDISIKLRFYDRLLKVREFIVRRWGFLKIGIDFPIRYPAVNRRRYGIVTRLPRGSRSVPLIVLDTFLFQFSIKKFMAYFAQILLPVNNIY